MSFKDLEGQMARLLEILDTYDVEVVYHAGPFRKKCCCLCMTQLQLSSGSEEDPAACQVVVLLVWKQP